METQNIVAYSSVGVDMFAALFIRSVNPGAILFSHAPGYTGDIEAKAAESPRIWLLVIGTFLLMSGAVERFARKVAPRRVVVEVFLMADDDAAKIRAADSWPFVRVWRYGPLCRAAAEHVRDQYQSAAKIAPEIAALVDGRAAGANVGAEMWAGLWVSMDGKDMEERAAALLADPSRLSGIETRGVIALRSQKTMVNERIRMRGEMMAFDFGDRRGVIAVAEAPDLCNLTHEHLAWLMPGAHFTMTWMHEPSRASIRLSVRAASGGVDASWLMRSIGGGGSTRAAGGEVPLPDVDLLHWPLPKIWNAPLLGCGE